MPSKNDVLSADKITDELQLALDRAVQLMRERRRQILIPEILLLAFVTASRTDAYQILSDASARRGFDWGVFEDDVERAIRSRWRVKDAKFYIRAEDESLVSMDPEMLTVLDNGLGLAEAEGQSQCSSAHALAAMAHIEVSAHWPLSRRGLTRKGVMEWLTQESLTVSPTPRRSDQPAQKVYERQDLLDKLTNMLSIQTEPHVLLVGPDGVGKRSLVLALAQRIAEGRGPLGRGKVTYIKEQALLDDPAQAVRSAIQRAQGDILFVPDIARFAGGIRADLGEKAGNELQKAFLSNNVVVIGTVAPDRLKKLESARAIVEQSQTLHVPPTTPAETVEVLRTLRPQFERDYKLSIAEESLTEVARLAERYYTIQPLPGGAVRLLHQACALMRTSLQRGDKGRVENDNQLDPDDVLVATSLLTDIPVTKMGADERDRYANMVEHLHKRIIGQNEAVVALSRAVKMARVGLKDPKRPIGSFMFLGPTGVGKSELAKALAEFMFGSEDNLTTLDMSEFMEDSSVNRLIGSPPGYIGHESGGQLTEAIKKQPFSIVLFDEVEKASVKVFDVLLQVLDAGRLSSGQGETVSFSECVILMTSNIGSRHLANPDLDEEEARELAEIELKAHFRPEFLNRLDDIIFFHLLSNDNLRDILDLMLKKEEKLLAGRKLHLEMSDDAKSWLLAQNEHPEWGARPLRRLIQRHIREPVADFILSDDPAPGTLVKVGVKEGKLVFEKG